MKFKFYINKPLNTLSHYCVNQFQVKETNKTIDDIQVFKHDLNVKITLRRDNFYLILPIYFKLKKKNNGAIIKGKVFTLKIYLISSAFSIITSSFFYLIQQNYLGALIFFFVSFLIIFTHFIIQIKKSLLFFKNVG